MYKNRFIHAILAVMFVIGTFVPAASAGSGKDAVYKVTFDDNSEVYTLMDGAAYTDGRNGRAVRLDGEQKQYVKLDDDITEALTGDYTISVDVYPENDANFARVFDLGTDTTNFAYFTVMGGGVPKFRYKGDDLFSDGVFFNVGEWNNVVITKNGGEARLFINGELAASSRSFVQPLSALGKTDANYLGKSHFENDAYFTGMIDNFAIYDYAVQEKDIKMANGGEVQVKAGFKNNNTEALSLEAGDEITSYADINNYKNNSISAKLICVTYDVSYSVMSTVESDKITISSGESASLAVQIEIPDSSDRIAKKVVSYIYTDCEGLERIATLTHEDTCLIPPPIPEDTFETTIGVHDPSIFKDPKSGVYYVYSTGMIDIFKSDDLVNWTKTVNTLPDLPQCVYDTYIHDKREEYSNIWAPDMFYDESDTATPYHLTCSYSDEFGKNNSSIILFKSASPEGPWENGQIIFTSKSDDAELGKVNAIDSNICVDRETGQKYMVYGSFWHGIHIKELNDDGTVKDPETVGKRIMSRKDGVGGPEGAYVVYNEDNGFYYLFTSFDSLSDTYNIRVARSKSITGPYVDENGVDVDRFEAENNTAVGYKLMGSWQFPMGNTYYGPGHCSVLNDDGKWYLVHHQRTVKGGFATLNVREMMWTEDGWPVVTPERYQDGGYTMHMPSGGVFDLISIGDNTNAMLTSKKLILGSDGTASLGDIRGTWNNHKSCFTIKITLGNEVITGYIITAWDYDENRPTIQFTGTNQNGKAIWGKKAISSVVYK